MCLLHAVYTVYDTQEQTKHSADCMLFARLRITIRATGSRERCVYRTTISDVLPESEPPCAETAEGASVINQRMKESEACLAELLRFKRAKTSLLSTPSSTFTTLLARTRPGVSLTPKSPQSAQTRRRYTSYMKSSLAYHGGTVIFAPYRIQIFTILVRPPQPFENIIARTDQLAFGEDMC